MDRIRRVIIPVLASASVLGSAPASSQARDPFAATLRARAQQQDESPAARDRRLAERLAWLQRLVGQFHAASTDTAMGTAAWSSTDGFVTVPVSTRKEGRAECVAIGIGLDVSCLIHFRTPQGAQSVTAIRVTLPVPPPDEMDRVRDITGSLRLGRDRNPMTWVSLQGNTANFRMDCQKPASGTTASSGGCRQQVSILAKPEGTRVRISIYPNGPASTQNTVIELHRGRHYTAGEDAARRSGQ